MRFIFGSFLVHSFKIFEKVNLTGSFFYHDDDDTETVFQETRINVTIIDTKSAVGYHGAAVRCKNSTHGTFSTL